jgi:RNA polymerase sigma-B factor
VLQTISDRRELQEQYHQTRDRALRDQLLTAHAGLARSAALRFAHKGQSVDDLTQVALIALLQAIDRFDPARGLQFSTYAMPTMLGVLKRYMRDQTWAVRPPRRVHDQYLAVERAVDDLTLELRRHPTIKEVAEAVGVTDDDVLEAIAAGRARQVSSLDTPIFDGGCLQDVVPDDDEQLGDVDRSVSVSALLKRLRPDEERVLRLRFGQGMSQLEIGRALGRSQMQISRILTRSLERLRYLAGVEGLYAE